MSTKMIVAGEYSITIAYNSQDLFTITELSFKKNAGCLYLIGPEDISISDEKMNELIDKAIYADMHSFEQRRDERAEMSARD